MRRLLIIIAALLLVAAAVFVSYRAFSGHDTELNYDETVFGEKSFSGGVFKATVKCTKTGYFICGYDCEAKDDTLYITFQANIDKTRALETDEEGYIKLEYDSGDALLKYVYYRSGGKTRKITGVK